MSSIAQIVRSVVAEQEDFGFKGHLRRGKDKHGNDTGVIADEENIAMILMQDPELRGAFGYDEFSDKLMLMRPLPGSEITLTKPESWRDEHTIELTRYLQRSVLPRLAVSRVDPVVRQVARAEWSYHPLRDWLNSVIWDRTPRLESWLYDYCNADDKNQFVGAAGKAFLISAVARVMRPGCQADHVLLMEGGQGIKKSTALRVLAGDENFSDSLPSDLGHKDAASHLRGLWICELPELKQFRRNEIETVKAFITRRVDRYRPSYGRHEVEIPRQCVFAGTTNDSEYLVDDTGNRRFWPVKVGRVAIEELARDREQIWAEAVAMFRSGAEWWLTEELEAAAAIETQARVTVDPWTPMVMECLKLLPFEQREVTPGELLAEMDVSVEQRSKANAARIGSILRDLGWVRGTRSKHGVRYVRP